MLRLICIIYLVLGTARAAEAQLVDSSRTRATVAKWEPVRRGIGVWLDSIHPLDFRLQYDEGKNLEFWLDESTADLARLDSAFVRLRQHPRLTVLYDAVGLVRGVSEDLRMLGDAFTNCSTCDERTAASFAPLRRRSNDLQRQARNAFYEWDRVMTSALDRADALADRTKRP